MTQIVSTPNKDGQDASGSNSLYRFAYFQTKNIRPALEDALAWRSLSKDHLTPSDSDTQLSPAQIGERLWTACHTLDNPDLKSGCTATTTIYDGMTHFITATIGDASSFVLAYDDKDQILGVYRLNRRTHTPKDPAEKSRIEAASGTIVRDRVRRQGQQTGSIAITRSIGDVTYKSAGLCADADIDIINFNDLALIFDCDVAKITRFQILCCSDGFTDGAGQNATKKQQELYVLNALRALERPGSMNEEPLARLLSMHAITRGSVDNISLALNTIIPQQAVQVGVYDGHGGIDAACYVAEHIVTEFPQQCILSPADYNLQAYSVAKNREAFERDNSDPTRATSTTTATTPGKLKRTNAGLDVLAIQSFFAATASEQLGGEKKARVGEQEHITKTNNSPE